MAMYNNGFPATYQSPYQYPQLYQQNPPANSGLPQSQSQNGIIWVSGEAGAKAYLVAPNTTVQLWDSESQTVYLKSADASGMPSMKVLDYTIRDSAKNPPNSLSGSSNDNLSSFATKDEINAITEQITALKSKVSKLTKKMEENEDE